METEHETVIAAARARFDQGARQSARDALADRARRYPEVLGYRDALVEFARISGHPDQAGRWGAHDEALLRPHEARALRRSLVTFRTEEAARRYLALTGPLPLLVQEHLDALGPQRSERALRWAGGLDGVAWLCGVIGGLVTAFWLCLIAALAFVGDPSSQESAQRLAYVVLALIVVSGVTLAVSSIIRRHRVFAVVCAIVAGGAVVMLAQADISATLPFSS